MHNIFHSIKIFYFSDADFQKEEVFQIFPSTKKMYLCMIKISEFIRKTFLYYVLKEQDKSSDVE